MSAMKNEREHLREPRDEKVVFQIFTSAHGTLPPGTVVRCSTKDISARGIRLQLDRPLSEGSMLELGVEISDRPGIFFLAGEVKWCRAFTGSKRSQAGLEIKERESDDFGLWQGELERWSLCSSDF